MKAKDEDEILARVRRPALAGPTAQARQLAEATARLKARRQRDALPLRIVTPRLVLRGPIRGDVPDLVRLADNAAIASRLARLPHPYRTADAIQFIDLIAQQPDHRAYAVALDDRFIGVASLMFRSGKPPEIGYWLGEPFWGRGLMSEAAKGLVDAAFATGLIPRLHGRALKTNLASQRIMLKLGFTITGEGIDDVGPVKGREVVFLDCEAPRWS